MACWACTQPLLTPRLDTPTVEAPEREAAFDEISSQALDLFLERQARTQRIAYRLRTRGVALCGDEVGATAGLSLWRAWRDFSKAFFVAFEARFGSAKKLVVAGVADGSPGDIAGIRIGDRIEAVNGRRPTGIIDAYERIGRSSSGPRLTVQRGRKQRELSLSRVVACDAVVFLKPSDWLLSGQEIRGNGWITTGLLRFAQSDDELAALVANEIAHRFVPESVAPDLARETRADAIILSLMQAAGYHTGALVSTLERLAAEHPAEIAKGGWGPQQHGHLAARLLALESDD